MKWLVLISTTLFVAGFATAEIPDLPPNACYRGCSSKMKTTLQNFMDGKLISFEPAVYSGECHHLSASLDPDQTHYAAVLIDNKGSLPQFYTIFTYFAEQNDYLKWDLAKARREMSPDWEKYGPLRIGSDAARFDVLLENGAPVYVYWMRQNPSENQMHLIMYAGGSYQIAFCDLNKHQ